MKIDFENPPMAPEGFKYTPEDLQSWCQKIGGEWYCTAFVRDKRAITVCAISRGKKIKPTLREVMVNAIDRANG